MEKDMKMMTETTSDIEVGSTQKPYSNTSTAETWLKNVLLSVETQGIERVTAEERMQNTTKVWHACTFW
jgi:hypothetical protein